MKKFVLSSFFFVILNLINGQVECDLNIVDPLSDIDAIIEEFADPCCGLDSVNIVSYDIGSNFNPTVGAEFSLVNFSYNSILWSGNLVIAPNDYDFLASKMTQIAAGEFNLDVHFDYDSNSGIISCFDCPIEFGGVTLYEKYAGTAVVLPELSLWECPYRNAVTFDTEEFLELDEHYDPQDIAIFSGGTAGTITTHDFTESLDFSYEVEDENGNPITGELEGAPTEGEVGYLLNFAKQNGYLGFNSGCFNLNCIEAGDLFDNTFNSTDNEIFAEYNGTLDQELLDAGIAANDLAAFKAELESEIDEIGSLAEFLNEFLGANIPIIPCDSNIEYDFPLAPSSGSNFTASGSNKSSGPDSPKTEADLDFFSKTIGGMQNGNVSTPSPSTPQNNIGGSVNLFNGSQSSNISLHQLDSRDLSVPISLSSSNNGLKVDEIGSVVGQQWMLNAGGSINREVRGFPDELLATIEGEMYGKIKKLGFRAELPSSFGLNISLVTNNKLIEYPPAIIRDGFGDKTNLGAVILSVKWLPLDPSFVHMGVGVVVQFNVMGIQVYITISAAIKVGFAMNEEFGIIETNQRVVGYQHLNKQGGNGFLPAINDITDLSSLTESEKAKVLRALSGASNFDEKVFLNDYYGSFKDLIEAHGIHNRNSTIIDFEPDQYHFNVGGYQGSFFINQDDKFIISPYIPELTIKHGSTSNSFVIQLPNGQEYSYGETENSIEQKSSNNYFMPTFYTYPGVDHTRENFGKAKIAQQLLTIYPPFGPTIQYPYSATYDRNFSITKNPSYNSKWNLTTIRSNLTNEEISLSYIKEVQEYIENKSINHSFPFTGSNGNVNQWVTQANYELNPFENKVNLPKWENGRAQFSFNYSEAKNHVSKVTKIIGSRGEEVEFKYLTPRVDIVNTTALDSILIYKTSLGQRNFFKGWVFDLANSSDLGEVIIDCSGTSTVYETPDAPIVIPDNSPYVSTKYNLGEIYKHPIYGINGFIRINMSIQWLNLPFQIPIPYPTSPILTGTSTLRDQFDSFGSFAEVKAISHFLNYNEAMLEKDLGIFKAEFKKSFIKDIYLLDRNRQAIPHPQTSISYHGDIETLEKRFSTNQNELGYASNNSSGSCMPKISSFKNSATKTLNPVVNFPMSSSNTTSKFSDGINKNPDLKFVRNGAIKSITGETGLSYNFEYDLGFVEIDYNPKLHKTGGEERFLIGLLVKSIDKIIPESENLKTKYVYSCPFYLGPTLSTIYSEDHDFYYKLQDGTILDNKLSVSNRPFSHIPLIKGNIVGFQKVTEVLGDNYGHIVHKYITNRDSCDFLCDPIIEGIQGGAESSPCPLILSTFPTTASLSVINSKRKLFNESNCNLFGTELTFGQTGDAESKSRFGNKNLYFYNEKYNNSMIGKESQTTHFQQGQSIPIKTVTYEYSEISNPEISQVNSKLLNHQTQENNHQPSFLQNYSLQLVLQFSPLPSLFSDIILILQNLVFCIFNSDIPGDKAIERNHFMQVINVVPSNTVLDKTIINNYYPSTNTYNSSSSQYSYRTSYNLSTPSSATNYRGQSEQISTSYFLDDVFEHSADFTSDAKAHLTLYNYRLPISSKTEVRVEPSGSLTEISFNTTTLGLENGSFIVPLKTYGLRAGNLVEIGRFSDYLDGQPQKYELAKHLSAGSNQEYFSPITFSFNSRLQLTTRTYIDQTQTYTYDNSSHLLLNNTTSDGIVTTFTYDDRWRNASTVSSNGRQTTNYTYSVGENNNFVTTDLSFLDGTTTQSSSIKYDATGQPLKEIRLNDNAIINEYVYDGLGRAKTQKNITTGLSSFTYEPSPSSSSTIIEDAIGNISQQKTGGEKNGYFSFTESIDPNDSKSTAYQNDLGLTALVVDPLLGETKYKYDPLNRLVKIVNPVDGEFEYQYNEIDKPHTVKVPNKASTKIWWDKNFRPVVTVDGNNITTINEYDEYNRIIRSGELDYFPAVGSDPNSIITQTIDFNPSYNVLENVYLPDGSSWLISTSEKIYSATSTNGGTTPMLNTIFNNLDELGRPENIDVISPSSTIKSSFVYTDALLTPSTTIDFTSGLGLGTSYTVESVFDDILRPTKNLIEINGAQKTLSELEYNDQQLVGKKFLANHSGTEYLQQVDYYYDSAGKLVRINDLLSGACTGGEFCDFQVTLIRSNAQVCDVPGIGLICNFINGIYIDEQFYSFGKSFDIRKDFEKIVARIRYFLEYHGVYFEDITGTTGNINSTLVSYKINIFGTNISSINLGFSDCGKTIPFYKKNCQIFDTEFTDSNNAYSNNKDLYFQKLSYDGLNISKIEKDGYCVGGKEVNSYTYDANHRLLDVHNLIFKPQRIENRFSSSYEYDAAGNINTLQRQGYNSIIDAIDQPLFSEIDDLVYNYMTTGTDKILQSVADNSNNPNGQQISTSYTYNNNGNLLSDSGKGITNVVYASNNLPTKIEKNSGNILFDFTLSGVQLKKRTASSIHDYYGGIEFKDGVAQYLSHAEGRYNFLSNKHEFVLTDHLGNNVVMFSDDNQDGELVDEASASISEQSEVLQRNFYYSFGMLQQGWTEQNVVGDIPSIAMMPENNYLYNGKELHKDEGLNWSNYGARFYDPAIARWTSVDPMAEYREWVSPYNYCQLNPISRIDPDGRFDTKFSARWHKWFHGGGDIVKTEDGWGVIQNSGQETLADGSVIQHHDLINTRKQKAHANSFSAGFSFGGGIGFEIGMVYDDVGNVSPFGSFDANLGFSLYSGPNFKNIQSTTEDGIFRNRDWEGDDASTEIEVGPLGYSWGADIDDPSNLFDPSKEHYREFYKWTSWSPDPRLKEWKKWKNNGLGNAMKLANFRVQRSTSKSKLFWQ